MSEFALHDRPASSAGFRRWAGTAALAAVTLGAGAWALWPLGPAHAAVDAPTSNLIAAGTTSPAPRALDLSKPLELAAFRTPLWVSPPPPPAPPQPPPPPPPLKLQLIAIVEGEAAHGAIAPTPRSALIYDPDQDKLLSLTEGQSVQGRTVERISATGVDIKDQHGTRSLSLKNDPPREVGVRRRERAQPRQRPRGLSSHLQQLNLRLPPHLLPRLRARTRKRTKPPLPRRKTRSRTQLPRPLHRPLPRRTREGRHDDRRAIGFSDPARGRYRADRARADRAQAANSHARPCIDAALARREVLLGRDRLDGVEGRGGGGGSGVLPAGLAPSLAEEVPVPIESLHAVAVPIVESSITSRSGARHGDAERLLVLACPRELLTSLDPSVVRLTPESIPGELAALGSVDPQSLNLLVGEFEPMDIRRSRVRRQLHLAIACTLCAMLGSLGLYRRAQHARALADEEVAAAHALLAGAAPDAREETLTIEVRALEAAADAAKHAHRPTDAAAWLEAFLKSWPVQIASRPQSLSVQADGISLGVVVDGDPEPLVHAITPPAGFALDEPRITSIAGVSRVNLHLRPVGASTAGTGSVGTGSTGTGAGGTPATPFASGTTSGGHAP